MAYRRRGRRSFRGRGRRVRGRRGSVGRRRRAGLRRPLLRIGYRM